jgi:hypothetical protein
MSLYEEVYADGLSVQRSLYEDELSRVKCDRGRQIQCLQNLDAISATCRR